MNIIMNECAIRTSVKCGFFNMAFHLNKNTIIFNVPHLLVQRDHRLATCVTPSKTQRQIVRLRAAVHEVADAQLRWHRVGQALSAGDQLVVQKPIVGGQLAQLTACGLDDLRMAVADCLGEGWC